MEMRFKHWTYGAIALSVLGAVANWPADRLPFPRFRSRSVTAERAVARGLQRELSAARRQLAMAQKRDHLLAEIGSAPDEDRPIVIIDETVPAPLRAVLETELESVWAEIAPLANHGIRFALNVDFATNNGYEPRLLWYVLPEGLDGTACLSSLTLNPEITKDELDGGVQPIDVVQRQIDRFIPAGASVSRGPCAFYIAFGPPGTHVREWLVSNNLDFARLADWARPQPKVEPPNRIVNSLRYRTVFLGFPMSTLDSHACASGRAARCRAALFPETEPERTNQPNFTWSARDGTLDGWFARSFEASTFGPPTSHLLSDVVREVGPERFKEFWTSELPVDDAFASVVGRDIGEWTSDWIAAEIGRFHFGPGVRAGELVMVVLFAGVGALAGAGVALKRKVAG